MDIQKIKQELVDQQFEGIKILSFCKYLESLREDKKNVWTQFAKDDDLVYFFKQVNSEGLNIDGEIVSLVYRGKLMLSLTYKAYKNLVLLKYPETKFDVQLVKENDIFSFRKENGNILYKHEIKDPFNDAKVIGAYCIIKNRKGEGIETMSLAELEKIKNKATMKYIWKDWENEMYLKTIIRRACKRHCFDITRNLDEMDNENFDLKQDIAVYETPTDKSLELFTSLVTDLPNRKELIEKFTSKDIEKRRVFYKEVKERMEVAK